MTLKTWGEHIDLSTNEAPQGTQVHLAVHAALAVADWGEGSDIMNEVRNRLGGEAHSSNG